MVEDYTQVNSYQEKLLEAMQIVSSQLISSIPYDKTIVCTIIDDTEKEKGKYKVSNADATFDAYSSDTALKKDDVVYVTIPEGNYDNQKIIQGKKTSDTEKPFVFTTPYDTILDVTDNLIIEPVPAAGLVANNGYKTKFITKEVEGQETIEEVIDFPIVEYKPLYNLTNLKLSGYTRLYIKAKFMSWLPNAIKGSYGLRITVTDNLNTTTTDEHQVANVQQTKVMLLDVSDMYGNPYNYDSYYDQEKVFSIVDLNDITDIKIDFYQIGGSFFDVDNNILTLQDANIIEEKDENDNVISNTYKTEFGENLFVDNIEIGLGYDVSEVTDELIVPVINDSMSYSAYREADLNKKMIDLRWVHQFEDGPKVVEPDEDFDGENARLKDCEIRWYRYRLGAAAADEYSGVYWTGLTATKQDDNYILSDWNGATITVDKTDIDGNKVFDEDGNIIQVIKPDYGETQPLNNVVFIPNTNYQTEQIKAIIFLNGVAIRGPVITFTNEESTIGKELTDFINALEIECVDGTQGNYLLYNEAGNILNYADVQLERKLSCNFAMEGSIAKSNLLLDHEKGDTISWKIPIQNTMISLQRCGETSAVTYKEIVFTDEKPYQSNKYYIEQEEGKYELAIGDKQENIKYYEQQINSDTIDLNKIWIQINEYNGPIEDWATWQAEEHRNEQNKVDYYVYKKNGVEYYKHPTLQKFDVYYEPWNIYKDKNQNYIILQGDRTLHYNENTKITSILYPTYKINGKYNMYNMNNTIACTIRKDRMIYTTEKEFIFGVSGTMGSDKSIVVNFIGGHTAIIANDTTTSYQLEVKMYDENGKPMDLSGIDIKWSWYRPGDDVINSNLRFKNTEGAIVELNNTGLTLGNKNQIYIAQVTVGENELTTYFPIPIKSSEEYSHIDGATSVIYLSNGEPDYYKGDYKLYITNDDAIGSPDVQIKNGVEWKIISQESDTEFIANIEEDGKQGLKPIGVYTSGIKNYAVIAKVNNSTVWQQPILVIRNQYPSRVINKWDGKTLIIDEEEGTVLSTAIAAGKKDDNKFTGVMVGDWTGSVSDKSLTGATGVFGFHQGEMCYAFTDDGKAFLGKDGRGRIDFDGNSGKLFSKTGAGMSIDLDDGLITSKRLKLEAGDLTSNNFIILNTDSTGTLPDGNMTPNGNNQYPFEIGKYLKADYTGRLYAASGKIGGWNFIPDIEGTPNRGVLHSGYNPTGWSAITLDPINNIVTGGKFRASVLEALNGAIKLGGKIDVYPFAKNANNTYDENTIDYSTSGGTFGFVTSNFGFSNDLATGEEAPGIGIMANGGGVVKATNKNVGMSIGGTSYLSITSTNFVGKASNAELKMDTNGFAVKTNNGRLIATGDHSGIGYGTHTYVALYSDKLQLASSQIDLEYVRSINDNGEVTAIGQYMQINSSGTQLYTPLIVGKTDANAATTLNGTLTVGSTTTLNGTLTVGSATTNAATTLNGTLTVGSIGVNAATILNGTLQVIKSLSYTEGFSGSLSNYHTVQGGMQMDHLAIGSGTIPSTAYGLIVNGATYIGGAITATGGIVSNGEIAIKTGSTSRVTMGTNGQITAGTSMSAPTITAGTSMSAPTITANTITANTKVDFTSATTQRGIRAQFA